MFQERFGWALNCKRIISTASALATRASGTDGTDGTDGSPKFPRDIVKSSTDLLSNNPNNTIEAKNQLLIGIASNRQAPGYASAFLGGVMTLQEIARVDESKVLTS